MVEVGTAAVPNLVISILELGTKLVPTSIISILEFDVAVTSSYPRCTRKLYHEHPIRPDRTARVRAAATSCC